MYNKSKLYLNILSNTEIEKIFLNFRNTDIFGIGRAIEELVLDKLRSQSPSCYMLDEISPFEVKSKLFRSYEPKPENIDSSHWEVTPLYKLPRRNIYE